jgi:hypothetical protein
LPEKAKEIECKLIVTVLTVSIDKTTTLCLSTDEHKFLYSLPYSRLKRVVGPYLAELKGKVINIVFLDEGGPIIMGTLPV